MTSHGRIRVSTITKISFILDIKWQHFQHNTLIELAERPVRLSKVYNPRTSSTVNTLQELDENVYSMKNLQVAEIIFSDIMVIPLILYTKQHIFFT